MMPGLRSALYPVADLDAAERWYTHVLGTAAPRFNPQFKLP
jgi:extradiol dioxygenase family protein